MASTIKEGRLSAMVIYKPGLRHVLAVGAVMYVKERTVYIEEVELTKEKYEIPFEGEGPGTMYRTLESYFGAQGYELCGFVAKAKAKSTAKMHSSSAREVLKSMGLLVAPCPMFFFLLYKICPYPFSIDNIPKSIPGVYVKC